MFVQARHDRRVQERAQHELHVRRMTAVLEVVRRPAVRDAGVEGRAIGIEERIRGRVARIAVLGVRGVVAPAERRDQPIVEQMALAHDTRRLQHRLAVEVTARLVRGDLVEHDRVGVARIGVRRGIGLARAARPAHPHERIRAVLERPRRVLHLGAAGTTHVVAILALRDRYIGRRARRRALESEIRARRKPRHRRRHGVHRIAPRVLAVHAILVFAITRDLEQPQPLQEAALLREIELVGELSARGVPLLWVLLRARLVGGDVRPPEERIGRAVDQELVHIDRQLAGLAVVVRGAHEVAGPAIGILPHERRLGRQKLPRRVEDGLIDLDIVRLGPVPEAIRRREIDRRPVVDVLVADRGRRVEQRLGERPRRRAREYRAGRGGCLQVALAEEAVRGGRARADRRAEARRARRRGPLGHGRGDGNLRRAPVHQTRLIDEHLVVIVAQITRVEHVGAVVGGRGKRGVGLRAIEVGAVRIVDRHRDGVPVRLALRDPVRDVVARRDLVRSVTIGVIARDRCRDGCILQRPVLDHALVTLGIHAGGLPHVSVMLENAAETDRQLVGQEYMIVVESRPPAAPAVTAHFRRRPLARQVGRRRQDIDRARRIAEAKDVRIRAAADLDAFHFERVDRHAIHRLDVVERHIGRADAANPVRLRRIVLHVIRDAAVTIDRVVCIGARTFRSGHVQEHVVHIQHREVAHLRLRQLGDRRTQVGQLRVETRAGQGVGTVVPLLGRPGHLEGREGDDLFLRRFRRDIRLRGVLWRGGLGERRRQGEGGETNRTG